MQHGEWESDCRAMREGICLLVSQIGRIVNQGRLISFILFYLKLLALVSLGVFYRRQLGLSEHLFEPHDGTE